MQWLARAVVRRAVERSLRSLLCQAGSGCLFRFVVGGTVEGDDGGGDEDDGGGMWAMVVGEVKQR